MIIDPVSLTCTGWCVLRDGCHSYRTDRRVVWVWTDVEVFGLFQNILSLRFHFMHWWYQQCPLMGTELCPWNFTLCTGIIVSFNEYLGFELFLYYSFTRETYFRSNWKYLTDGKVTINRKWVFLFLTPMGIYFWSNTRKMDARSITTLRSIFHMYRLTHYLWIIGLEESSVNELKYCMRTCGRL